LGIIYGLKLLELYIFCVDQNIPRKIQSFSFHDDKKKSNQLAFIVQRKKITNSVR